jgi:hypothetical protein
VTGIIGEFAGGVAPAIGALEGPIIAGVIVGDAAPWGVFADVCGVALAGLPAIPPLGAAMAPGVVDAVGVAGVVGASCGFVAVSLEHAHNQSAARLARDSGPRSFDRSMCDMRTSRRCSRKDAAHRVETAATRPIAFQRDGQRYTAYRRELLVFQP